MKQMRGAPSNAIATPSTGTGVDEDRQLCDPHAYSITSPIPSLITPRTPSALAAIPLGGR